MRRSLVLIVAIWGTQAAANLESFVAECANPRAEPAVAIQFCTEAIKTGQMTPTNEAKAYYNRGMAFYAQREFNLALRDHDLALERDPNFGPAWAARGDVLLRFELFDEALRSFDRAIDLMKPQLPTLIGRGLALLNLGRAADALTVFDQAAKLAPKSSDPPFHRALALLALEDRAGADEALTQAITLDPADIAALMHRARLRAKVLPDYALADYATVNSLRPDLAVAWFEKGRLLDELNRTAEANFALKRAHDLGYRDEWLHERVLRLQ